MNRLRYCYNNDNGSSNVISSNKINYLLRDGYVRAEQIREEYPQDFYSRRRIYPRELKLQEPSDLYSPYFYPTYVTKTYPKTMSYRPGGCCTPNIYYTENVEKRTIAYRPYVKRVIKPLVYSQIPDYIID